MSVSLILIPTVLAIATAVGGTGIAGSLSQHDGERGGGSAPTPQIRVQTRMKDPQLLADALAELGATGVGVSDDRISAVVDGLELTMERDEDGVWAAHIDRADGRAAQRAEAEELIGRLDATYARHVQRAVAARIRERADSAGFELVSESREDDDTVTMVLGVREERA